MKMIKGLVAVSMVAVLAGASVFAAPVVNGSESNIEVLVNQYETLHGKIKVQKTKAGNVVSLKADDGKTYVLSNENPNSEQKISMKVLSNLKGQKVYLSGNLNPEENIFNVLYLGKYIPENGNTEFAK